MKKEIDYSKILEADVAIKYINARLRRGLNTNLFVIGLSGTGKSSTSIRLGELIGQSRDKKTNSFIVYNLLQLIEAIKKAKSGDVVIVEEASVLFPSRRAMAKENVAIGRILDTIRKKELCLICNAPIWKSIDSHMQSMAHILIETLRINKTEGVVISKFHRIQTAPSTGKPYRHTMTRNGRDVDRMITRMPSEETWEAYEQEKDNFMDRLYERLKQETLLKEKKLDKQIAKNAKPNIRKLTPRELEVHQLYNIKGMTMEQVGKELNISYQRVGVIVKNIRKKVKKT